MEENRNNTQQQIEEFNFIMEDLASRITSKQKELDTLKSDYNQKLVHLNTYIDQLHTLIGYKPANDATEIDEEKLLNYEITCNKCQNKLFSIKDQVLDKKSEFIIVPKNLIKLEELDSATTTAHLHNPKTEKNTPLVTPVGNNQKHKKKKKLTCSFCNKEGHKRAECPFKLYQETM